MKNILVTALIILALFSGAVYALDNVEKQKIDFLISAVEQLESAKFIRNGSEYDGKEAAAHLRVKLEKAGNRVETVDDFIRLCASKSYMTGKPYLIKFSDGKIVNSEAYLRARLKDFSSNGK